MTPRTTCQLGAQCINRVHDASTASMTRQPRVRHVNREYDALTASTTRQPRAQRVNRVHNASTGCTMRQPGAQRVNQGAQRVNQGAQRVARTRPVCATHCLRPRCIARHSQCVNPCATTTMPFSPAFSASCPASLNQTTRQLPRERRVNRVHDASTACTRRFPLSPLCSPCESDSEQ